MTTLTCVRTAALEPTYEVSCGMSEDSVRASLIKSIEFIQQHKTNNVRALNNTAFNMMYAAEKYLNAELDALLRGTFDRLEEERRRNGLSR